MDKTNMNTYGQDVTDLVDLVGDLEVDTHFPDLVQVTIRGGHTSFLTESDVRFLIAQLQSWLGKQLARGEK